MKVNFFLPGNLPVGTTYSCITSSDLTRHYSSNPEIQFWDSNTIILLVSKYSPSETPAH